MLKRHTPMKRTGFPRATPAHQRTADRAPRALPSVDPSRFRLPEPVTAMAEPVVKREYVRDKGLREAYRLIPCQNCGRDDGTVCCAHSNWAIHGKGGAIKADDSCGASLCSGCHVPLLDQGARLSKSERQELWWTAHVRSVSTLVERGLWPSHIAVPNITSYPF